MNDFKKGQVVRILLCDYKTQEFTGDFLDGLLVTDRLFKIIFICSNNEEYTYAAKVGMVKSVARYEADVIADSFEEYEKLVFPELPEKIKEVIKEIEVVKEVKIPVRVDRYEETFIDRMYNRYCESLGREDESDFV